MGIQPKSSLSKQRKKREQMQSAVIVAPGEIGLQMVDIPQPAADEVLIRIEGCGLCASNLPPWQGREWFSYPMEAGSPGHEGWGVVEAVGENVMSVQPRDRVTAFSYHAYADYDIAKAEHVVKLPDNLKGKPLPGEPLGCAVNIFKRSKIQAGMNVAIIGVGFLGSLLIQLAKHAGAQVLAISRRSSSLGMAKRLGADATWEMVNHDEIIKRTEKFTGGDLCDCVIEATGKQEPLDLAVKLTRIRGRLVIAGYHQDGQRRVDMQLWNWRGIDVINAHERDPQVYVQGMRDAIDAVERNILDPFPLFTHIFPKHEIQQAFQTHQQKPEGFIKALINFEAQ